MYIVLGNVCHALLGVMHKDVMATSSHCALRTTWRGVSVSRNNFRSIWALGKQSSLAFSTLVFSLVALSLRLTFSLPLAVSLLLVVSLTAWHETDQHPATSTNVGKVQVAGGAQSAPSHSRMAQVPISCSS